MPERDEAQRIGEMLAAGGSDREAALAELAILYRAQSGETAREQFLEVVRKASKMDKTGFKAVRKDLEKLVKAPRQRTVGTSPTEEKPKIKVLKKYDARPAQWDITLLARGSELTYHCKTDILTSIKKFNDGFWEEHNIFPLPADMKLAEWRAMLEAAPLEIVKESADEGTSVGYLKQMIQDFEEKAKPEKLGELVLGAAPLKLDTGEVVLRLPVLMRFLRTEGVEGRTRTDVLSTLRELGYRDAHRRIGKADYRVWLKVPQNNAPHNAKNGKLPA